MGRYKITGYEVGEWLIHRQHKYLGEVTQVIEFDDKDHVIVVRFFDTMYYRSESKPISKINRLWNKAPMARLLYSKSIQRR